MANYKCLPQNCSSMARESQSDDVTADENTQTLRDVYGAVDMDGLESREEYDPALLPDGAVPEEAPDGRDYHTAAWDGGMSDLEAAPGAYTSEEGQPAVLVYVSNRGGVQVHEGEIVTCSGRVLTVEADDGTIRTAHRADIAGRENAVHNHAGADSRFIGTMLEVRLVESWDDYERRMELLEEARADDDEDDDEGDDGDDEARTDGGPDRLDTPQWKDRMGDLRTDGGEDEPDTDDLHCSAYDWCGGVPTYPTGACAQHAEEVEEADAPTVKNPPSWEVVAALAESIGANAKNPWVVTYEHDGAERTVITETLRGSSEDESAGLTDAETGDEWHGDVDDIVAVQPVLDRRGEPVAAGVDLGDLYDLLPLEVLLATFTDDEGDDDGDDDDEPVMMTDGGRRIRAEAVETEDGFEVLPPEVAAEDRVPDAVVEAVEAAVADEPNTLVEPRIQGHGPETHGVASLYATYQEQPAIGDDGDLLGWKAPYQAREDFDAALREHLPDGYAIEAVNNGQTAFYEVDA
ncbi:putative capsid protein VP18 [Haloarcula hispanica virus PH1]|uniref:Putative capsid protein VP18 n=1 Tax=Haloarcula hispanica virus PH1 TaxID=1282967 RepID=M4JFF3_9VIRU|nr:putative capsid protein VP18 [Haloarcula hispanica virus PH1]AGC65574.1 putative capsid protein VP18 [Haloarcula hispanica virus PH1]